MSQKNVRGLGAIASAGKATIIYNGTNHKHQRQSTASNPAIVNGADAAASAEKVTVPSTLQECQQAYMKLLDSLPNPEPSKYTLWFGTRMVHAFETRDQAIKKQKEASNSGIMLTLRSPTTHHVVASNGGSADDGGSVNIFHHSIKENFGHVTF